jgi:hypothetical protein
VTLAGTLDLVAAPGLAAGSPFRIIDNSGSTTAITGTFTGLPEGAEFYEDSQWWRISYTGGTGNDVLLTRITPTPMQTWQSTNFSTNANNPLIAGDLADPAHDGISNLLERAMAMNPNASDPVPISMSKSGATLDFIYTKNKSATELAYTVEWSDTLANDWSLSGVSPPTILSDNGVTQQIKVTVPAGSGVARRFVHLKVTRP